MLPDKFIEQECTYILHIYNWYLLCLASRKAAACSVIIASYYNGKTLTLNIEQYNQIIIPPLFLSPLYNSPYHTLCTRGFISFSKVKFFSFINICLYLMVIQRGFYIYIYILYKVKVTKMLLKIALLIYVYQLILI
jgi:hypothetical protein